MAGYTKKEINAVTMTMSGGCILTFILTDPGMPLEAAGKWGLIPAGLFCAAGFHVLIEQTLYERKQKRLAREKAEAEKSETTEEN